MISKADYLVVIPFFNEEYSLKNLQKDLLFIKENLIFINDNSIDNGPNYLKNYRVINNNKNIGYEKSLLRGLIYAKNNNYKYVITFDADNQHRISDLKKMINLLKEEYDLIIGYRNYFNRYIEYLINYYFYKKFKIKDILSGLKAYRLELLDLDNKIYSTNSTGIRFSLNLLKNKNYKFYQFKIFVRKRNGKSTFGGMIKGNYTLLKSLISTL